MDTNDKSPMQGGGFPPPLSGGLYSQFSPPRNNFNVKSESSSSALPPVSSGSSTHFSNDLSRMHDNPPKNLGHRRAHSEVLTLPDDINFDSDLGVVGGFDGPSFSDDTEEDFVSMYLDVDKFKLSSATSNFQLGEPSSSTAADAPSSSIATPTGDNVCSGANERSTRLRHQHSQSMDVSTLIKPEMLMSGPEEGLAADSKKAMSAAKLAELALVDPKRAKRISENRQSAARSKERKMRHIAELERKVQTLQTKATTLSAQLTLLQRDTNGITAENSELKLRLQTTEQQVQLQDALNYAIKEEIQHLKAVTGQMANGGPMLNFQSFGGGSQQYYPNNNPKMHSLLAAQQFQQLHINPHLQKKQQQLQQQHQQLQLQRQQLHLQHLEQQHQHQQSGELRARVSMPSPRHHMGNSSDTNPSGTRDSGEISCYEL